MSGSGRAVVFLAWMLVACGDSSGGSTTDGQLVDAGEPECTSDVTCAGALACIEGVCQRQTCEGHAGTEGCACGAGDRCARGADGQPLTCSAGLCISPTCPAGQAGCICRDGIECDEGATCTGEGYCVAADCAAGEEACACLSGTCDVGLFCLDGALCVDGRGYEGGPCLESGLCNPGALCNTQLDTCLHCDLGSEGCACDDTRCNDGLTCNANVCVDAVTLPPLDPKCYTPCRANLISGEDTRVCASDGLLDGCIDDLSCQSGSCLAEGEDVPTCVDDNDCPFFQTCLAGGCYSNCESDLECGAGLGCYHRVCRVRCESTSGAAACATGQFCDAEDGASGYCVPLADAGGIGTAGEVTTGAGVQPSVDALAFSNVRTTHDFGVSLRDDDESITRIVTVRKLWHRVTRPDGTSERVDAPRDPSTGELVACDAALGECPLWWLELSVPGEAATRNQEVQLDVIGGCVERGDCPDVTVSGAGNSDGVRWEGALEVIGDGGRDEIRISYVERPEGQWSGAMVYLGSFADEGVATWKERADKSDVSGVSNGLIRRWGAFRAGSLSGWEEMAAVFTATRNESWSFGEVADRCPATSGACYPYTNTSGVRTFVTNLDATPIPRGATELPFVMNLRQPGLSAESLVGRIDTGSTLHYPGDPEVTLSFSADPSGADACDPSITTNCVVWLSDLTASAVVGGRYVSTDGSCAAGFVAVDEPWLIEGFTGGTSADESGRRSRVVCYDAELPYDTASDASLAAFNQSLAGGNPIPDGQARRRSLELLDGALIDQNQLVLLFREQFESFVDDGSTAVSAYGYALLNRRPADLPADDEDGDGIADIFQGTVSADLARPAQSAGASCDGDLLADIAGGRNLSSLSSVSLRSAVDVLIGGSGATPTGTAIADSRIHYYCEETGFFDGGAGDDGTPTATRVECPVGSRVVFFSLPGIAQSDVAAESCQSPVVCDDDDEDTRCGRGTCADRLEQWRSGGVLDVYEPYFTCDAANAVYCDDDRLDLRTGKTFYRPAPSVGRTFNSLIAETEAAFRYRTRFTSSSGSRVGFAPQICIPDSDQIPYCYEPDAIDEVRQRIDCLITIYSDDTLFARLDATRQSNVQTFLKRDFAEHPDGSVATDGFERLFAELLVMQADEAFTKAYASRFDLAGVGGASFEGSLIEPDGIDLSGVAGLEMLNLYRAVQLYQLALDRLYSLGPNFTEALSRNPSVDSPVVFLSAETVTLYLERLIRASTQKARAYSEIASRYQGFDRPDLARQVIRRAYTAAHLESVVLERLMRSIEARSTSADRPQITQTIVNAQRRYRMALLDMRSLYARITDEVNHFGFAPEYVPFPVLDASAAGPDGTGPARNAFEVLLARAKTRRDIARAREIEALASNREFQTDAAQFQAELVRVRNNYEAQLLDLCGSFVSDTDGRVYAAIVRYAAQDETAQLLGDPCGRMGNGEIHERLVEYQNALLDQQLITTRTTNLLERIAIEQQRVSDQCDNLVTLADYQYEQAGEVRDLERDIANVQRTMEYNEAHITAGQQAIGAIMGLSSGGGYEKPTFKQRLQGFAGNAIRAAATEAAAANAARAQNEIRDLESDIADIDRATARWITLDMCEAAQIDSNAAVATMLLRLRELELEALRADYQSRLLLSEALRLSDQAARLQDQQTEAQGLLVDVEAARNDPNVRIYRNDAIINADISFADAIRQAYRATKVFEYYTSQSYDRLEELFLIRMVSAGDRNLDTYLVDLENAFLEFEERYGAPDTRVVQLSLMDDILQIPTLDESGHAITDEDRYALLREAVQDVDRLDANGWLRFGFETSLDRLSPLTRNHTIEYIEVEMAVTAGDNVGRLYLQQAGTGVIYDLDDELDFYVLPERTAVIQPFFNGSRPYDADVYQSRRFQDRPLVNTNWQLVINQRDELENRDIRLDTLTDVRFYIYYTDFTP